MYIIRKEGQTSRFRDQSFLPLPPGMLETSGLCHREWGGSGLGEAAGGMDGSGVAAPELPRLTNPCVSWEVASTEGFPSNPG